MRKSPRDHIRNKARLEEILPVFETILPNRATADEYGPLFQQLRMIGRSLPVSDVWNSALAVQHGLVLLTRDPHLAGLPEVQTLGW